MTLAIEMKVLCVVEHGNAPSTRLRLRDCLEHYQSLGVDATVLPARRSSLAERLRVLKEASRHDVVVLFKTIGFNELELSLLQRANRRIVFDFDDAVMFREQKHRRPLRAKTFKKFLRTVRHCEAVVAGNDFLASFAEACGRRAVILPTSIDLTKYKLKQPNDGLGLTIGWLGLSDGLPYLRHIHPALQQLSARFPGLKLKVISDKPLQLDGVVVQNEPWRLETEQANLASFDIGIMPLWDSVWTRGKCGYKILQYMGVGTAVVASDVGVNSQIITHGENGFLARSIEDWIETLGSLIANAEQRKLFGTRGRELIEQRYSLETFAKGYVKVLREVAQLPGDSPSTITRSAFHRWNFSSRARELSGGDAIVISVPKSGRTWVRTFLCAYFCKRAGRPFTLRPDHYHDPTIPRLIFSHDFAEQRMKGRVWDRIRGKYLVPARELARARVILLVRDPRDAFVSLYMQLVHRTRETPQQVKEKKVGDLMRDRRYGIMSIIKTMNDWFAEFGRHKNFTLLHYESLRGAPEQNFRALLATLGETSPDPGAFKHALEFSDFGNMQRLETAGVFDSKILRSADVRNPESFKVRRGKVGGYRDYLSPEDQAFAADALKHLDARFGYTV
ncbi:MAG TPA: sulfotransferase domain-containing protein [Chthoniobacterales bacterium]|jgi:glycosyltransferase involved in cell wall biosynthesis|nr:sulfotransferase domain-containing protein [Chthoniobacterales bacterium]